jgi:predicted dehydrogenase/nucleoside-diphosphate-sugar epimerase
MNRQGPALKVALVGLGKMGQHHARAIERLGGLGQLACAIDPSPAARAQIQQVVPGVPVFERLEDALDLAGPDVVHVCTSRGLHASVAETALAAGCHVYIEKPFAESVEEARHLIDLATSRHKLVCAGHQLLFERPAVEAMQLVGALGRVIHVESYFSFRTVRRAPGGRAPLRDDLQLLDILPHPVYLLLRALEAAQPDGSTELEALDVGTTGTLQALLRRGRVMGTLVVTLEGRPVENYLRLVGTNGSVYADFVRGTVQRLLGPGTSGIDKALNPFRQAKQLIGGTTTVLGARVLRHQRNYPGLREIFQAFYSAIQQGTASPISPENILQTTVVWEKVKAVLDGLNSAATVSVPDWDTEGDPTRVAITGGTGFLGKKTVQAMNALGVPVRVLARRLPPAWERVGAAQYREADMGAPLPPDVFAGVDVVVHCAAETAGSWADHERNSVAATEHVLRAAHAAGVTRVIHVSSIAVHATTRAPIREESALERNARGRGPYVWGKLTSEQLALRLGTELGIDVRIVRPSSLVDYEAFEAPGRLGKRVGNVFVAVGSRHDPLGIVDVSFAGQVLTWMALRFDEAPRVLNLLAPELPTRGELVKRLRSRHPELAVVWLPMAAVVPLAWVAVAAQRVLRPRRPAMNVAKAFANQRYDKSRVASIAPAVGKLFQSPALDAAPVP